MRLFLAALSDKKDIVDVSKCLFMLESFYYIQDWQIPYIHKCKDFLLDSGAFTFFTGNKSINWDDYVDRYANFIVKNNIKNFFELDIDKLVGYNEVLRLRKKLEGKTQRRCIPVWHTNRGKDEWIRMCEDYSYVALGGLVGDGGAGGEYAKKNWKYFPYFIETAHKNGAKIHALGFTSIEGMKKYRFDSVDSTSWKSGGRFGQLHQFTGDSIRTISFKDKRASDYKKIDKNNYDEWIKFQRYVDMCL